MSSTIYKNNINRILRQMADLKKKEVSQREEEVSIKAKINTLSRQLSSAKSLSAQKRYQNRINTESKKLIGAGKKLATFQKTLANKSKELSNNQTKLNKAIAKEKQKVQNEELKFLKEKQRLNKTELNDVRQLNSEIERQQMIFQGYTVTEDKLSDDEEYNLDELKDLYSRIDIVLEKLEKLGYGQEIIFSEIEELKSKSKKVTKKDLKLMLIGKIVSFGGDVINPEIASDIFETITGIDLTKLIS